MTQVFLLQNQDKLLLNKQGEWTDGSDLRALFRTVHKDEAINQMFEASAKDYTQRVHLLPCDTNDKGQPLIADDQLPDPALLQAVEEPAPSEELDAAPAGEDESADSSQLVSAG